ncbi:MAG: hypothetical protein GF329_22235 [Candidatus Lokiarchaeota archaeon]|nr:hypothetical protein [Candidatus Lokiarchaeota archaeon]
MDSKEKKEMLKVFNKALKLFRKEKLDKAADLFREAGRLAHKIGDIETETDSVKFMKRCLLKIQENLDKKKRILKTLSQNYMTKYFKK